MQALTKRRAAALFLSLGALSLLAFLAPWVGESMQALYGDVDFAQPYLTGLRPTLLYVLMPLSVLGGSVLVMTPGLLAVLALQGARTAPQWVVYSFGLSLAVVSGVPALVQALTGWSPTGKWFVVVVLAIAVPFAVLLAWRLARGTTVHWPLAGRRPVYALVELAAVPLIFLILLTPKFFWESFNGDGAHAFESTRLLLHQSFPFWPGESGYVAVFPGMSTFLFAYPSSWFMRLFGEYEFAVRAPMVLFLMVLYAAVAACVRAGEHRPLGSASRALIWLGLWTYGVVVAYSATYNPYSADIALPAAQDTLLMVSFLGTVLALQAREYWWLAWFALLTATASAGGLALLGAFLAGLFFGFRERPYGKVIWLAGGLALCVMTLAVVPKLLGAFGFQAPGGEHGPTQLLRHFAYLNLFDFRRVLYATVPCGIYAVTGLLAWRRTDDLNRALIVTLGLVFCLYYVSVSTSIHYYVPVMILLLVVFWRAHELSEFRHPWRAGLAYTLAAVASLMVSLPSSIGIYTASRETGERVDVEGLPGYEAMEPRVFLASELLFRAFPAAYHADVPDRAYGGSPLAWIYYAQRARGSAVEHNYILSWVGEAAPRDRYLLASDGMASLYVSNLDDWEADQSQQPRGSHGSFLYDIPRDVLFGRRPAYERPGVIPLGPWIMKWAGRDD